MAVETWQQGEQGGQGGQGGKGGQVQQGEKIEQETSGLHDDSPGSSAMPEAPRRDVCLPSPAPPATRLYAYNECNEVS